MDVESSDNAARNLTGRTEEKHENLRRYSRCSDRDSSCVPSEYKSGALPLEQSSSVIVTEAYQTTSFEDTDVTDNGRMGFGG
jgi:hypothetical protein